MNDKTRIQERKAMLKLIKQTFMEGNLELPVVFAVEIPQLSVDMQEILKIQLSICGLTGSQVAE